MSNDVIHVYNYSEPILYILASIETKPVFFQVFFFENAYYWSVFLIAMR